MPYLTDQISEHGAVVDLLVGVIDPRRQVLEKHSMPVPARVLVRAVIDTGASSTAIDHEVLRQLGLSPTGKVKVQVPSTNPEPEEFDEYAVSLTLKGPEDVDLYLPLLAGVICCYLPLRDGGQVLLGRDVLKDCLFVYDGNNKVFSFAF